MKDILTDFESHLDLFNPEGGPHDCSILDYGELTVVLLLSTLPKKAIKRISGLATEKEAIEYKKSIERYINLLGDRGIKAIQTDAFNVVYLV